jgi:uncharacterized membrane protein YesL
MLPGLLAVSSVAAGGPGFLVAIPAAWLCLGVALPVGAAGMAHLAKQLIETKEGSVGEFLEGLRRYGLRAAGIGSLYVVAAGGLVVSAMFYATKLQGSVPLLGVILSALAVWGLAFLALSAMFVMPALVQRKAGVWPTLRLAGLLASANPLLAIGLALQTAALTLLSVPIAPLFFTMTGAFAVVLQTSAYELISRKYEAAETGAPPVSDEDDDYLNRGFRDFMFPWKG